MPRLKKPTYSCDFETTVNEERTRVWLWGKVNIDTEDFEYGEDIDSFMNVISKRDSTVYFHNLKFDGNFIIYWLFKNGFQHTFSREIEPGYFGTLISDMGLFYTITIVFPNKTRVLIIDSLKKITMPVRDMPKAFGLDIEKLEIDYEAVRDNDHKATEEEIQYVKHDCLVVAKALKHYKEEGLTKMTAASNALNYYKKLFDKNEFDHLFPGLTEAQDKDCRLTYKGGWTYVNPIYQDKLLGSGQVYDVNSMYPWTMMDCLLPYGIPKFYEGEYQPDKFFPLYIQCLRTSFKLKPGKYPSIQLKGNMRFGDTEYIKESLEPVLLHLTSVDLELMKENYELWDTDYICGYMFMAKRGLFKQYIEHWYGIKNQAKKEGNKALATIAKLMLNSLYGKFGTNPVKRSKYPYYDEEKDIVRYHLGQPEKGKGGYVPMASFITSYARDRIIRAANACGDRFVYADTDSIHILGSEIPDIDIDEYRLGAFKLESTFERAKFHRAKCYIEQSKDEITKKCAGLPEMARNGFNFDTMAPNMAFEGKLAPKIVPGGVILKNTPFTIK